VEKREEEGVKWSVYQNSKIIDHEDLRWDSEFICYEPYENELYEYKTVGEILNRSQYGISIDMNEFNEGVKIYRMNELSNMFCVKDIKKNAKISDSEVEKFKLHHNDILFNRTNSQEFVGRTGIYKKFSDENIVFASYLIRLNPNETFVLPEYLTAFLNTKFGVQDVKRRARISINQSNVNAEELKKVRIPILSKDLQIKVKKLFDKSFLLLSQAERQYSQAQTLLLKELDLLNWQPKHQLSYVKTFSDTQTAERFDAEYFQPKYEEVIEKIKGYSGGFDELGALVTIKKCVEPGSDAYEEEGVPFVRVSNLSKYEINTNNQQYLSEESYTALVSHQPKKGEILLSKDATPGIAYYLNEMSQKMIPSGGMLRLQSNNTKVKPEYLTLVLNSEIVQTQIKKDAGGSIINHWRPDQVKATVIPILDENLQDEIVKLVQESFDKRSKSKALLEIAKTGVEKAIETTEEEAMQWMTVEIDKLDVSLELTN
jgi:restriction endonuclease S subunit